MHPLVLLRSCDGHCWNVRRHGHCVDSDGIRKMISQANQSAIDIWNTYVPVGSRVTYFDKNGNSVRAKTRSRAQMLAGRDYPVVWLECHSGCVPLAHCQTERVSWRAVR